MQPWYVTRKNMSMMWAKDKKIHLVLIWVCVCVDIGKDLTACSGGRKNVNLSDEWFIGAIVPCCHCASFCFTWGLCENSLCVYVGIFSYTVFLSSRCLLYPCHSGCVSPGSADSKLASPAAHWLDWSLLFFKRWKRFLSCTVDLNYRRRTSSIFHLHSVTHSYYQAKSHSFHLMRCFYVQFPFPSRIITACATVNKATDRQSQETTE